MLHTDLIVISLCLQVSHRYDMEMIVTDTEVHL